MMNEISFFNKLNSVSTQEILDFIVHNQTNLVLKIHDRHYKTKMLAKKNNTQFSIYKFNFFAYQNEAVICSFDVKDEKYFFKSSISATETDLIILIPTDVYQLQRRNDFRISLTQSMAYECEVKTINFQKVNLKAEMRDLSLGGCLISLRHADKFEIPKDSEVEIALKIGAFENPSITTTAKHVHMIGSNNTLQLGLHYLDPSADFLRELQTLLVHLDRVQRGKSLE